MNGQEVDCAKMTETAKSWFKTGLWVMLGLGIIGLIGGIFWLVMLIHALSNPIPNKILWVAVIFFLSFVGAVIYYFVIKRKYTAVLVPNPNTPPYQMNVGVTYNEGPVQTPQPPSSGPQSMVSPMEPNIPITNIVPPVEAPPQASSSNQPQ